MNAPTPQQGLARGLAVIERTLRIVVATLVVTIVMVVAAQVLFRYAFKAPIIWSEEFTTLAYQWLSYLGAALAVRYRAHFNVDFVVRHFSARWDKTLARITHAAFWVLGLFMIFYGARIVANSAAQMYPTLPFSVGTGYLILPIAGALVLLMDLAVMLDGRPVRPSHA